jgi:GxxExxY protein
LFHNFYFIFIYLTTEITEKNRDNGKEMEDNKLTEQIIGLAIKVHRSLGPGLLESAYQECLFYEIKKSGLHVEKEKPLPLVYEDVKLDCGYRIDLLVERQIVIELKSVETLNDVHTAQVLTYLKLSNCKIGLLINFNVTQLTVGLKRLYNKYYI